MFITRFSPELAKEYGVPESVLFLHLAYWVQVNEASGQNMHEGVAWTFNTLHAFGTIFPCWSERTIQGALLKLEKAGLIQTARLSKDKRDRTKWYTLTAEGREISGIFERKNCAMQDAKKTLTDDAKTAPLNAQNLHLPTRKETTSFYINKDNSTERITERTARARASCSPELSEAMHDFEEMRRKMKRPLTEKAKEMILKKLAKLAGGDEEKEIAILHQSIMNSWQGVFPLHEDDNRYGKEKSVKDLADEAVEKLRKAGMLNDERGESGGYQNPFGVFENVSEHESRQ